MTKSVLPAQNGRAEPHTGATGYFPGAGKGRRKRLAQRVLTSIVLIAATACILFFTPPFYFSLQVTVFVALALFEFLTLLKEAKIPVYRIFGIGMGAVIPLVVTLEMGVTQAGEILFLVFGCLSLFLL